MKTYHEWETLTYKSIGFDMTVFNYSIVFTFTFWHKSLTIHFRK